jgi:hypothetical protein
VAGPNALVDVLAEEAFAGAAEVIANEEMGHGESV